MLRQLPRTALNEAEKEDEPWSWLARWVKRNPVEWWYEGPACDYSADCQRYEQAGFRPTGSGVYSASAAARCKTKIREVHFYFHKYDVNKRLKRIIMDAPWPNSFRKTFVAAASKKEAELRLAEIARGGGSISQSWRLKIKDAQIRGDQKTADYWADKVTGSILQWETGRQWLLYDKVEGLSAPPKIREIAHQKFEEFYAADVRRLGRKEADEKWKGKTTPRYEPGANDGDYIVEAMITSWLTFGHNGFPGFCFMSDELLANLLGLILPLPRLLNEKIHGWKTVRTIRERIGLKKAEILFTGIKEVGDKKWAILDRRGMQTHWISRRPN